MLLQAKASLERIDNFLNEPEVDDEISSLKKDSAPPSASETDAAPLGFKKASFRWNSTELAKSSAETSNGKRPLSTATLTADDSASVTSGDAEAVRFELRDISISFPQGKLTVVTGPTASGKTALIVSLFQYDEVAL